MLVAVLVLVLIAFGLLVVAVVTGSMSWAWGSVGASVVAAAILIAERVTRRRRSRRAATGADAEGASTERIDSEAVDVGTERASAETADTRVLQTAASSGAKDSTAEMTTGTSATGRRAAISGSSGDDGNGRVDGRRSEPSEHARDPGEEDDGSAPAVSDPTAEVLVVDEHPRYHLESCGWLTGRSTLPLPLAEARELGFTPCAWCAPHWTLAGTDARRT